MKKSCKIISQLLFLTNSHHRANPRDSQCPPIPIALQQWDPVHQWEALAGQSREMLGPGRAGILSATSLSSISGGCC